MSDVAEYVGRLYFRYAQRGTVFEDAPGEPYLDDWVAQVVGMPEATYASGRCRVRITVERLPDPADAPAVDAALGVGPESLREEG